MTIENATPGDWAIHLGGGHAPNSIRGGESIQVDGWPEDSIHKTSGGQVISNRSYSERICENLGDLSLPGPKANANLIIAAKGLYRAAENAREIILDAYILGLLEPAAKDILARLETALAKARGESS